MWKKRKQWQTDFIHSGSKITAVSGCSHDIRRHLVLGRKPMANLDSILKSRDIILLKKVCLVKAIIYPVAMYKCESWTILNHIWWPFGWAPKNWCFWTVVLEKTPESPLDSKEIKPANPKRNQLRILIGRTDAVAEAPILCPPDVKCQLTGKDPWYWQTLRVGGERGNKGWDGWMVSLTQWTWVWANSGKQWRTRKPGMLQSMRSQRVIHDWASEQHNMLFLKHVKHKKINHNWNMFTFLDVIFWQILYYAVILFP